MQPPRKAAPKRVIRERHVSSDPEETAENAKNAETKQNLLGDLRALPGKTTPSCDHLADGGAEAGDQRGHVSSDPEETAENAKNAETKQNLLGDLCALPGKTTPSCDHLAEGAAEAGDQRASSVTTRKKPRRTRRQNKIFSAISALSPVKQRHHATTSRTAAPKRAISSTVL